VTAPDDDDMKSIMLTTEAVYPAHGDAAKKDYHKALCGELFMNWVRNRLHPTFQAMFPGKIMWLMLDNYSVHHIRSAGFNPKASGQTKGEVIDGLAKAGCKELIFEKGRWDVGDPELRLSGSSKRPTVAELQKAGYAWVVACKPDLLKTDLQRFADTHNIQLVFTPPYQPKTQPIELLWGHVKYFCGEEYKKGDMTLTQVTSNIRRAFRETGHLPVCVEDKFQVVSKSASLFRRAREASQEDLVDVDPVLSKYGTLGAFELPETVQAEVNQWFTSSLAFTLAITREETEIFSDLDGVMDADVPDLVEEEEIPPL